MTHHHTARRAATVAVFAALAVATGCSNGGTPPEKQTINPSTTTTTTVSTTIPATSTMTPASTTTIVGDDPAGPDGYLSIDDAQRAELPHDLATTPVPNPSDARLTPSDVAVAFAQLWRTLPAGITAEDWSGALAPYATPELAASIAELNIPNDPNTSTAAIVGPPQPGDQKNTFIVRGHTERRHTNGELVGLPTSFTMTITINNTDSGWLASAVETNGRALP